jgi:homoserine dehydrogenase
MGLRVEFSDVQRTALYTPDMESLDAHAFLAALKANDDLCRWPVTNNQRTRYLASITRNTDGTYALKTGVEMVAEASPFFTLSGPENMVIITIRNQPTPIVISRPGAGIEITAQRIVDDICSIVERIAQ